MNVVIVEDEVIAAQILQRLIVEIRSDFKVMNVLQSVEDSIEWFLENPAPELVFMDIHLADGSCFEIFEKVEINCPIIFTTSYHEYALEAFEVNGIDYLLKPINRKRLEQAIAKFENLSNKEGNSQLIAGLLATMNKKPNRYKTHFLIPHKDKLIPLAIEDIAYFYSELKIARVACFNSQNYTLSYSLDELMKHLDPEQFFRANRQYIIAHKAIHDISVWFGGKLAVNLRVKTPGRITVSKARTGEFKLWYTKGY